jgi:hypothetical protein
MRQNQDDARTQLSERTADLQWLQAEYMNFKRRVDRDRAVDVDRAVATAPRARRTRPRRGTGAPSPCPWGQGPDGESMRTAMSATSSS